MVQTCLAAMVIIISQQHIEQSGSLHCAGRFVAGGAVGWADAQPPRHGITRGARVRSVGVVRSHS